MPSSEELQQAYGPDEEILGIHDVLDVAYHDLKDKLDDLKVDVESARWDRLAQTMHETSVSKGFWSDPEMMDKYAAKLALIHSEVTEVLEALRKRQGADAVTEEFADILIRTFDLHATLVEAGEAAPNLYRVMVEKMNTNKNRPALHNHRWG